MTMTIKIVITITVMMIIVTLTLPRPSNSHCQAIGVLKMHVSRLIDVLQKLTMIIAMP